MIVGLTRIRRKFSSILVEGGHRRNFAASAVALAADELFDAAVSFVVAHLDGRMLGEIGRGRMASMAMPAELGESSTESFRSISIGTSPKRRPSTRMNAILLSSCHGT